MKDKNKKEEHLKKMFQTFNPVPLDLADKNEIRRRLIQHMQEHPGRKRNGWLQWIEQWFFAFNPARPLPVALAVFLVFGASVQAQASVPGDFFYSYKVHVIENVRSWVAVSDEARTQLAFEFAVERLEEAEVLVSKDQLTLESQDYLIEKFEEHVLDGYDDLGQIKDKKAFETSADIAATFESDLKAHERILSSLVDNEKDQEEEKWVILLDSIHDEIQNTVVVKTEVNATLQTSPYVQGVAQGKGNSVEIKIDSVENFYEENKEQLNEEVRVEIESQIEFAQSLMVDAKEELEGDDFPQAFVDFQGAQQSAHEVNTLIQGHIRLNEQEGGKNHWEDGPDNGEKEEPLDEQIEDDEDNSGPEAQQNDASVPENSPSDNDENASVPDDTSVDAAIEVEESGEIQMVDETEVDLEVQLESTL